MPYQIESVARACRVIGILQSQGSMPLFELAEMAGLSRPTVFRLVATLQANGFVMKGEDRRYRLAGSILPGHKYKIGYIAETGEEFVLPRGHTRIGGECGTSGCRPCGPGQPLQSGGRVGER